MACVNWSHAGIACAGDWPNAASERQVNHIVRLTVYQNIRRTASADKELVSRSVQFDRLAAIPSEKRYVGVVVTGHLDDDVRGHLDTHNI